MTTTTGERRNINPELVDVDGNPLICADGRSEHRYAALRVYAGEAPLG